MSNEMRTEQIMALAKRLCAVTPWDDEDQRGAALQAAIEALVQERDAALVEVALYKKQEPVAWVSYARKKPEVKSLSFSQKLSSSQKAHGFVNAGLYLAAGAQPVPEGMVQECDALKAELIFVERWAVHHASKPHMTPKEALSCIAHYPPIRAITKAYSDGVFSPLPNPYEDRDKLAAENEVLQAEIAELEADYADQVIRAMNAETENEVLRDALEKVTEWAAPGSQTETIVRAVLTRKQS